MLNIETVNHIGIRILDADDSGDGDDDPGYPDHR